MSRLPRSLSTIRAGTARAIEKVFMRTLTRTSQTYLEMLVPYLNNLSEETIFGSKKSKEQQATMKFQNKAHLKP